MFSNLQFLKVIPTGTKTLRHATGWVRRVESQPDKDSTIYKDVRTNYQNSNRVFVFGYAGTGALGVKEFVKPEKKGKPRDKQLIPKRLDYFHKRNIKINDIACGYGFTVFMCTKSGESRLYGTGINTDSQLGFSASSSSKGSYYSIEPHHIKIAADVSRNLKFTMISCGRAHTVALTESDGVYTFGNNAYGQCGRRAIPGEIFKGSQIINHLDYDALPACIEDIECGQDHTLLLTTEGRVYSCGLGADGQTGQGHYDAVDRPTLIEGDLSKERIVQVSSKADCILAVNDKGDLFGWGNSEYNQLSIVSNDSTQVAEPRHLPYKNIGKVKKAVAAGSMCALLNEQGQVFVWGYGILGAGPAVRASDAPILLDDALFGKTDFSPERRIVDIEAGLNYFTAINDIGELYVWGKNKMASLGIGTCDDQMFPLKAHIAGYTKKVCCGVDHTVILANSFEL